MPSQCYLWLPMLPNSQNPAENQKNFYRYMHASSSVIQSSM
jgi:hypothetical protein